MENSLLKTDVYIDESCTMTILRIFRKDLKWILLLSLAGFMTFFEKRKFLFRNVKTRFFELCNTSVNAL